MSHAHFLGMGGFTLVDPGEPEPEGLDPPDIRETNIPVQPKVPEWNGDPDSLLHYFDEVNDYWVNARKLYADDRKEFWEGWDCTQRKCSVYSNFIPKSIRDRSLLRLDEEDYSRYERYGHRLPPHLLHLRESPGILTFYRFQDLVATSTITFPAITAEEIRDKSKGDLLSKVIAILQTTWFIVQCAARPSQGLAVTELELATLALASLNVVTYFLWWDKPLDVKEPVKVYFRGAVPVESNHDRLVSFSFFFSLLCHIYVRFRPRDLSLPCRTTDCCPSFYNSSPPSPPLFSLPPPISFKLDAEKRTPQTLGGSLFIGSFISQSLPFSNHSTPSSTPQTFPLVPLTSLNSTQPTSIPTWTYTSCISSFQSSQSSLAGYIASDGISRSLHQLNGSSGV